MHGVAAEGVPVVLSVQNPTDGVWTVLSQQYGYTLIARATNGDGRCKDLTTALAPLAPNSTFKLAFDVKAYWVQKGVDRYFFPVAEVIFHVPSHHAPHYHVPLVITPFAYNTYRGT
ncbi:hypothetical protein HDV03_000470 [Kappamyces sp. JEL0829]|nr:hypothetical protein HDV03_000470 [Kappamyces sp. JEL0829]